MAGNYPDAPANRIAWDADNTVLLINNVQQGSTPKIQLNDDSNTGVASVENPWAFVLIFPRLMDIVAIYSCFAQTLWNGGPNFYIEWSPNTTNGVDGTWTTFGSYINGPRTGYHSWIGSSYSEVASRTPTTVGLTGVRSIRWRGAPDYYGANMEAIHLYGQPTVGQNLDKVDFWHPTLDQIVGAAYFDWGDSQRSSSETRQFRIKNRSATLIANSITVSHEALTIKSPSQVGDYLVSTDGLNFYSSVNIAVLSPGSISPILYVRRSTPANAQLGLAWLRSKAIVGSWT